MARVIMIYASVLYGLKKKRKSFSLHKLKKSASHSGNICTSRLRLLPSVLSIRRLIGPLQQIECCYSQQDATDGHQEVELISLPRPFLCLHLCDFPIFLPSSFLSFLKCLQFSLKHTHTRLRSSVRKKLLNPQSTAH